MKLMVLILSYLIGALLYRLRGGLFRDLTGAKRWWNGTQAMRLLWSLPTAVFATALTGAPLWMIPAMTASSFLGLALIGHGAHMTFDYEVWRQPGLNRTELLTRWLPGAFGIDVSDAGVLLVKDSTLDVYNIVGMGIIGVARKAIMISPFLAVTHWTLVFAFVFAAGTPQGALYWLAHRLDGGSPLGELLVGGSVWSLIWEFSRHA